MDTTNKSIDERQSLARSVTLENLQRLKTWLLDRQEFERASVCVAAIKELSR